MPFFQNHNLKKSNAGAGTLQAGRGWAQCANVKRLGAVTMGRVKDSMKYQGANNEEGHRLKNREAAAGTREPSRPDTGESVALSADWLFPIKPAEGLSIFYPLDNCTDEK